MGSMIVSEEKIIIRWWDWLLIIGLSLAPMTGLRIWKVGPAELLCFIWGLKYLPKAKYVVNDTFKFFLGFFCSMFAGTIIGLIIAPSELQASDWFTWIYLAFIALSIYEGTIQNELDYNERLLEYFSTISVVWYIFLYFYSIFVSRTFLGAPLWYISVRYTGGAQNPHQVAVLMCGLTFIFVRNIFNRHKPLINVLCCIGAVFVVLQTASSTGILSIFCSFLITIFVLTFRHIENAAKRTTLIIIQFFLSVLVIVIGFQFFYVRIYAWIASDPNGIGRFEIFRYIFDVLDKSPIFGLGPGLHSLSGTKEFHNTYLEILAASGFAGLFTLIVYTVRIFKKIVAEPLFIAVVFAIYMYGIAGFAMRRLAYWGILLFVIVISEQKRTSRA